MRKRRQMVFFVMAACILWIGVRWANSHAPPTHTLGVVNGQLAKCPNRLNCVSTYSDNPEQRMHPIPLEQPADEAVGQLETILRSIPRCRIVTSQEGYLHAECRTLVLGFVDDVEFLIDETEQQIHFRSAARVGLSDFGVNRKRMEEIKRRYQRQ